MAEQQVQPLTQLGPGTFEIASTFGERRLHQHLLVGSDGSAVLLDAGAARTPQAVIVPALAEAGIAPRDLRWLVVTHPDVDHRGGASGLLRIAPGCRVVCGFEDVPMVRDPEALVTDRYQAHAVEHGLDLGREERAAVLAESGESIAVEWGLFGGERLPLPGRRLDVLHVPGHAAGHLAIVDRESSDVFMADAVHGRRSPAVDGGPALPPTYEDVDAYLASIQQIRALAPERLLSGHVPVLEGEEASAFLDDSAAFVGELDELLLNELRRPIDLGQLCVAADGAFGPFTAGPAMFRFAVHGHLRRLVRRGTIALVDAHERPRRYVVVG